MELAHGHLAGKAAYGTSRQATYDPAPLARVEGPLTVEVLDTISRAQDVSNEIRHRLYSLRDRLTGSPPPTPPSAGQKGDAPHFKAEHASRSDNLLETLAEIDAISTDLANRL